VEISDQVSALT